MMAAPLAIHMNTNISTPMAAPMLSSVTDVKAFCMMMNRMVAMTEATVMKRAARKVKRPTPNAAQREKTERGVMKIMTKAKHAPERKRPNIQCDTILIRPRIEVTSAGRVTAND